MNKQEQTDPGAGGTAPETTQHLPHFAEFVVLISGLIGLTALSIDIMLPALGQISKDFAIEGSNRQQQVVTVYLVGFAVGQIFYGPLSDRFGRKPLLLLGLGFYALSSLIAIFSDSYEVLVAARFAQGVFSASARVLAVAVVRDIYGGRRMAEVMSFVMMMFILVPIVAPSIGGLFLLFAEWHTIFVFLTAVSLLLAGWMALRLPETHPAERREPLSLGWILHAFGKVLTTRQTLGYTVAMGFIQGTLMSYITLAEQIFIDVYHTGRWFPVLFGVVAAALALASFLNSRLVMRLGMHRISHIAALGFVATALFHLGYDRLIGAPSLVSFVALLAINLFFFSLMMPNFNALAMEPMARVAGTASSFIGALTTGMSAGIGWYTGQFFAGTTAPLVIGFAVCGLASLAIVLVTENGQLMRPTHDRDRDG